MFYLDKKHNRVCNTNNIMNHKLIWNYILYIYVKTNFLNNIFNIMK